MQVVLRPGHVSVMYCEAHVSLQTVIRELLCFSPGPVKFMCDIKN